MTREQLEAELRRCNDWMAADGKTIGELLDVLTTIGTRVHGHTTSGAALVRLSTMQSLARATVEKHTP